MASRLVQCGTPGATKCSGHSTESDRIRSRNTTLIVGKSQALRKAAKDEYSTSLISGSITPLGANF